MSSKLVKVPQSKEAETYSQLMDFLAKKVALYMQRRKAGESYVIAIRIAETGFGSSGRIFKTLDPTDPATAQSLKEMERGLQDAVLEYGFTQEGNS